jgi:hypothetical protein
LTVQIESAPAASLGFARLSRQPPKIAAFVLLEKTWLMMVRGLMQSSDLQWLLSRIPKVDTLGTKKSSAEALTTLINRRKLRQLAGESIRGSAR